MVNSDSKRYRVQLHTWGKNWDGKDYFKTDITCAYLKINIYD